MLGSIIVYAGLVITIAGLILVIKPTDRLHVGSRSQALVIMGTGVLLLGVGMAFPAPETRISKVESRLDEIVPVWQFSERHTIRIAAPSAQVFEAIRNVRGNEVALFKTLTWIRRGGRNTPASILNAGDDTPLLDVAIKGGFVYLADDAPREIVIGTAVISPRRMGAFTPQTFTPPVPPGYALGAMNFLVTPDGPNASIVSTETRVFASNDLARRRFARYWRVIYPGSALIRLMWLRAVERRAMNPAAR
jgi:hypothetical protein